MPLALRATILYIHSILSVFDKEMAAGSSNSRVGIQIRNMKMVFNIYCTWRWVKFEKLMMKIYDFFIWLSRLVTPYNIVQKSLRRWKIFYTILYGVTKRLSRIKKIINFHH